jgi:hypothetical protein
MPASCTTTRAARQEEFNPLDGPATEYRDRNGDPVPIQRLKTRVHVTCRVCGHAGTVSIFLEQAPKLRCFECGSYGPTIGGREPLARWARSRRKRNCG